MIHSKPTSHCITNSQYAAACQMNLVHETIKGSGPDKKVVLAQLVQHALHANLIGASVPCTNDMAQSKAEVHFQIHQASSIQCWAVDASQCPLGKSKLVCSRAFSDNAAV